MKTISSNVWFKGAFILTIAALVTKILSAIYRIPFQNIVGDTGFYIYQQVYPFYGVVVSLSTYGFPVVLSKLYMEMKVEGNQSGIEKLVNSSFFLLFFIGFLSFIMLFFSSENLAIWMGDPHLSPLLKVISFTFLLSPFIATIRGVFQGEGNMLPTAVSQVGEQTIRVGTILFAAIFFSYQGYSLYFIGAGALFGSITGGALCLVILLLFYKKARYPLSFFRLSTFMHKENRALQRRILYEGITISISSMLLILLQLADSLNLYSLLLESGVNPESAKVLKGVYDRGQPLIQIGTIISTSMALAIVPLITKDKQNGDKVGLVKNIRFSILISFFIGLGAAVGLISIIKQTNSMLFENKNGSDVLGILCCVIFLNALIATMTAILQGLGHSIYPAILIVLGFILKYMINGWLVSIFGINGAAYSTLFVLLIILLFMSSKLKRIVRIAIVDYKQLASIVFAGIIMFIVLKVFLLFSTSLIEGAIDNERIRDAIQALAGVIIGGFVYVFIVLKQKVFKEEDLLLLPFGNKLAWFLPKNKEKKL
ncbi:polysaccharide biosynthesis protein [Bacillus sp. B1-b2]|uniref:putative polysaccharide biosynthesis protein n=1 Tax=Bacillus sp. B1-b2 TaxID=2653201 RepID=UPI001262072D|nr:polysaccharide biosynthesis protein [Bacillus sp. B1-b2]KAB7664954.1 polysaccharide biosynthesis protein [Bacillus sp. B1-b2]